MCPFLLHVGLALDLDFHTWIYQPFYLNERRDREVVAEIRDAARVDLRSLRNVGHKHLHLDDVLSAGTGRLQAFVHDGDGDIELIDDIGGDATVLRLADDAGDPNVGPGTRHVAVVTDRRSDVRNDDPLNWRHGSPGVELSRRAN